MATKPRTKSDVKGKPALYNFDRFNEEAVEKLGADLQAEPEAPATLLAPAADEVGDLTTYAAPTGTQGRKGQKAPRMNLAIPEDVYEYIRRESKRNGMTYSEFICAVMRQRRDSKN